MGQIITQGVSVSPVSGPLGLDPRLFRLPTCILFAAVTGQVGQKWVCRLHHFSLFTRAFRVVFPLGTLAGAFFFGGAS